MLWVVFCRYICMFLFREFLELSRFSREHHICLIPAIDVDNHVAYADLKNCLAVPVKHLMALFSSK